MRGHYLSVDTMISVLQNPLTTQYRSLLLPTKHKVYVEAAKARKARIQERGADVERLLSLAGTPLLVDMNANANGGDTSAKKSCIENDHDHRDSEVECSEGVLDGSSKGAPATATIAAASVPAAVSDRRGVQSEPGAATTSSVNNIDKSGSAEAPGTSTDTNAPNTSACAPDEQKDNTNTPSAKLAQNNLGLAQELDPQRVVATASTPLLPCFSLGSRLAVGGLQNDFFTTTTAAYAGDSRRVGLNASASAGDTANTSSRARGREKIWTAEGSGRTPISALDATGARLASTNSLGRSREGGGAGSAASAALKAAAAVIKGQADALLASHLTPFPTITKNRSLHAVSQPIVQHSEGFADACRAESSRLGTTAWRVARTARYDGLVAPAERLSIVRQIEDGFDALRGRRVSPVA